MFGYARPQKLDLTLRQGHHYTAHYCGLCFALARDYGTLWRALTNFESTLLVLLMSAQADADPSFRKTICPVSAFRRFAIVSEHEGFMTLGAAFTVCMAELKSLDAVRDGSLLARPARDIGGRQFSRARRVLAEHSFDIAPLLQADDRLAELEAEASAAPGSITFDELTAPTADGLAHVFEYTGALAGRDESCAGLARLGKAVGRLVYLGDCLEDVARDAKRGAFNGLSACMMVDQTSAELSPGAADALSYMIARCNVEARHALSQLTLNRYRPIIENIILLGLDIRVRRLLQARTKKE
ncbi:MAG TPA: DUF5685 family protein [Bacillota bacterium]|nr:DUF5685 family protein [Bacillota bacterium]